MAGFDVVVSVNWGVVVRGGFEVVDVATGEAAGRAGTGVVVAATETGTPAGPDVVVAATVTGRLAVGSPADPAGCRTGGFGPCRRGGLAPAGVPGR
ncbi:MAG TPA: hypothetical protein VGR20_01175, partial [Acidimicrobiia bacterium]|nr:hypothetical protein [Acidimicrobiia bacterium]